MDLRGILQTKRDGGELSQADSEAFIDAYVAGRVPEYQAAALTTAIFIHGMGAEELFHWTHAMLHSGEVLDLTDLDGPKADKHSTGGVGDKVSIPLAPAVAACGVRVPMVSGRGLGHTAGTLDKLESIPGFRTEVSLTEFKKTLERTGLVFAAQTEDLVPADRKLYALRDVTGLIESVPLIASSILSKKLAEGIDALVLDVKFGSGAFLPEPERGAELGRTMLALAERFGLSAAAYQTSMTAPLGRAVGHGLEIAESIACLAGEGPADLRELVTLFGGEMLAACGVATDRDAGAAKIAASLDDGSARAVFERVVLEQGGDARCVAEPDRLPAAPDRATVSADKDGTLGFPDCRAVGQALCALGGGRAELGDEIDPAVGFVFQRDAGDVVRAGDPLVLIHHRGGRGLAKCEALLGTALEIGPPASPQPLVLGRIGE